MRNLLILICLVFTVGCPARRTYLGSQTQPPPPPGPITSFPATVELEVNGSTSDISVPSGSAITVEWSSQNALTCHLSINGVATTKTGLQRTEFFSNLTEAVSYSVTCTGIGPNAVASVNVDVQAPPGPTPVDPPTATLRGNGQAGSITVIHNSAVTLSWSSEDATSCNLYAPNGSVASQLLSSPGLTIGSITINQLWTLICSGEGGSVSSSLIVFTIPPAPWIDHFSLNGSSDPIVIAAGQSVNVRWMTSEAIACVITNINGGVILSGLNAPGGVLSPPIYGNEVFTLTCSNPGGTVSLSRAISTSVSPPVASITANNADGTFEADYLSTVTLQWTSSNAASCEIKKDNVVISTALSSTGHPIPAMSQNTVFSISCPGSAGGSAADSVNVTVRPPAHHLIFLSRTRWNGNLGGLSGANAKCQEAANNAGLFPGRPWVAVLSGSNNDIRSRLVLSGEIRDTQDRLIDTSGGLWDHSVQNDIKYDEFGVLAENRGDGDTWTGSSDSGQDTIYHCSNWTSSSSAVRGMSGESITKTQWLNDAPDTCNGLRHLYCISQ